MALRRNGRPFNGHAPTATRDRSSQCNRRHARRTARRGNLGRDLRRERSGSRVLPTNRVVGGLEARGRALPSCVSRVSRRTSSPGARSPSTHVKRHRPARCTGRCDSIWGFKPDWKGLMEQARFAKRNGSSPKATHPAITRPSRSQQPSCALRRRTPCACQPRGGGSNGGR